MDTAYNIKQRCFAGAIRSYKRLYVSLSDVETDSTQRGQSAETLPYLFNA
jgi:hypothetical protein